ncbi:MULTISPECIES: dodecin family protein [Roseicyclus]|uniref:dodecin family protein n=1 Tax=Roseicyclus amphidinii TaxID=3034232 RepID=UPI0024E0FFB6|nr:dodecin family protein [Roseicyclus sp. Amp-Y-6]
MSMLKVIEVLAESPDSFDAAAAAAVTQAAQTVRNIRSVYIKDMNAEVTDGRITSYRVNAKISFMVDGQSAS